MIVIALAVTHPFCLHRPVYVLCPSVFRSNASSRK